MRVDRRSLARGVTQAALLPPAAFAVHELRYLLGLVVVLGLSFSARVIHICTPWSRGWCSHSRWWLAGFCGRWDAPFRVSDRRRVTRRRSWGCGWRVRWPWSPSTSRRSLLRACLPPVIRGAWRGSSGMAAGGRFRPPCAWPWCWRRCSTALGGCSMRLPSAAPVRSRPSRGRWPRRVARGMSWCRGWRRWRAGGRIGVLRREAMARGVPLHGRCAPYRVSLSQL